VFEWNDADNDQIWYTDRAAGKSVLIDVQCVNFQSIAFEEDGDFSFVYDRLQNNVTGTMPLFIHGNGRTDMTKFYERL
jgi:ubiquinone biosynthesis protein COQ9